MAVSSCGLSGKLLPAHLKPLEDELLSSWLVRLAFVHGQKPYAFSARLWPKISIWESDVDRAHKEFLCSSLAEITGTSIDRVIATTLRTYDGFIYEKRPTKGPASWILPVSGTRHVSMKQFGLQFCPWCLTEDKEPYFRRIWRLAFVVLCAKHNVLLLDRCPCCYAPINYYRNDPYDNTLSAPQVITLCYQCNYDLRTAAVNGHHYAVDSSEVEFQISLMNAATQGWAKLPHGGSVYSYLYFCVIYQILKLFFAGRKAPALRESVVNHYGMNISPSLPQLSMPTFCKFGIAERRNLMAMARSLLRDWPHGFSEFCRRNRLWTRDLFFGMDYVPFWYWSVVYEELNRNVYCVTEEEFKSAVSYVRKNGHKPTQKILSQYFGQYSYYRLYVDKPKKLDRGFRKCPYCYDNEHQWRISRSLIGGKPTGNERFLCKACNRIYTKGKEARLRPTKAIKEEAMRLLREGYTYSAVGRILSVSKTTVSRWVRITKSI